MARTALATGALFQMLEHLKPAGHDIPKIYTAQQRA
jgi:hypothetical protein